MAFGIIMSSPRIPCTQAGGIRVSLSSQRIRLRPTPSQRQFLQWTLRRGLSSWNPCLVWRGLSWGMTAISASLPVLKGIQRLPKKLSINLCYNFMLTMNGSVEKQLKEIDSAINRGEYKKASSHLHRMASDNHGGKDVLSEITPLSGKIADTRSEYSVALY